MSAASDLCLCGAEDGPVHYVAIEAGEPGVQDAQMTALLDEDLGWDV